MIGNQVGGGTSPKDCVEDNTCNSDSGSGGGVAWAIQDVVLTAVSGYPLLNERVNRNNC